MRTDSDNHDLTRRHATSKQRDAKQASERSRGHRKRRGTRRRKHRPYGSRRKRGKLYPLRRGLHRIRRLLARIPFPRARLRRLMRRIRVWRRHRRRHPPAMLERVIWLGFVGLLAGLVWIGLLDDCAMPDDADLRSAPLPLAATDNAAAALDEAAERLVWPPHHAPRLRAMCRGKTWDRRLAVEILSANRQTLSMLENALLIPGCQTPPPSSLSDEVPHLSRWRYLNDLLILEVRYLRATGRVQAAGGAAITGMHLGRHMRECGVGALGVMAGCDSQRQMLRELRAVLRQGRNEDLPRREWIAALQPLAYRPGNLVEQFRVDYEVTIAGLQEACLAQPASLRAYHFQRNRCQRKVAKHYQAMLHAVHASWRPVLAVRPPQNRLESRLIHLFLIRNALGESHLSLIFKPSLSFHVWASALRCEADRNGTLGVMALETWQDEQGALPGDLAALAPVVLPSVPNDPFVSGPLRYDPSRGLLWSVGPNRFDETGDKGVISGSAADDLRWTVRVPRRDLRPTAGLGDRAQTEHDGP